MIGMIAVGNSGGGTMTSADDHPAVWLTTVRPR
ncbi:hypothetical protein EV138_5643 [Kribbella voronezhensis]|uniref:Uncharacterized protein n=1 Tax=Kribbella voronezhensis TaxID=2512212 RepID=A0A4R7SVI1_9ACTN|nr:hypothetical protein EV138_5643 [Kribbella voronezhensis]